MKQIIIFITELLGLGIGITFLCRSNVAAQFFDRSLEALEKHSKGLGVLISILAFCMTLLFIYDGHDWGGDFSEYLGQAIAIADGTIDEQINHMQFVLENSIPGMCPAVYPWGLPLVLSILYRIFGFNLIVFRLVGVACFAVFLFFVYKFLKKRFVVQDSVIIVGLIVTCKHYMEASTSILSDIPCVMFSMVAIYALYELIESEDKKQYLWSGIFGICTTCAYLLRSSGVVLILTLFCIHAAIILGRFVPFVQRLVERTTYKKAIIPAHALPYIIFIIGKIGIETVLPSAGSDYLGFINGMPKTYPITNALYYLKVLQDFFDVGNYLALICGILLLVFLIIGMIIKLYQEAISVIYIFGTMIMLYIFPYVSGVRYIFGIYPLFLMFALFGLQWVFQKIERKWENVTSVFLIRIVRYCTICVCLFMLFFSMRIIYKIHTQPHIDSAYTPEAMEAYEFLMENTEKDAVVMFFKPRVLWLNAHRYSYNTYDDVSDLDKCDYAFFFIKDNFNNLKAYITQHPKEYELIFDNVNFQIYKHNK